MAKNIAATNLNSGFIFQAVNLIKKLKHIFTSIFCANHKTEYAVFS